jgi:hypothetical protein
MFNTHRSCTPLLLFNSSPRPTACSTSKSTAKSRPDRRAGHHPCGIINWFGLHSRIHFNTREGNTNCYDHLTGYWVFYHSTSASILVRPTRWLAYATGALSLTSHLGWRSISARAGRWP